MNEMTLITGNCLSIDCGYITVTCLWDGYTFCWYVVKPQTNLAYPIRLINSESMTFIKQ